MASSHSPRWRRLLQRYLPQLFNVCIGGNYHWRWDRWCYCCQNEHFGAWAGGVWDCWSSLTRSAMSIMSPAQRRRLPSGESARVESGWLLTMLEKQQKETDNG